MGARRLGREMALQMLYAMDSNPGEEHPSLPQECEGGKVNYEALDFAGELVRGVTENRSRIDEIIVSRSKNWSLSRMARVDVNILRIAVYELLFRDDIPRNVTINEAIEVSKKFGTGDSSAFINGILDEIGAVAIR